ncbi:hypothetical protein ACFV5N_00890 [Streptomyces sp. NPDC059853]
MSGPTAVVLVVGIGGLVMIVAILAGVAAWRHVKVAQIEQAPTRARR